MSVKCLSLDDCDLLIKVQKGTLFAPKDKLAIRNGQHSNYPKRWTQASPICVILIWPKISLHFKKMKHKHFNENGLQLFENYNIVCVVFSCESNIVSKYLIIG